MIKTKTQAKNIFGSILNIANALGISRIAIYQWDEVLSQRQADEVTGAAVRLKLLKKCGCINKKDKSCSTKKKR